MSISKEHVIKAIMKWPGLYETTHGVRFWGCPVSQIPSQLREDGWRNVSQRWSDQHYLRENMGLTIVLARYVGGVHAKAFCYVVVAKAVDPIEEWAKAGASKLLCFYTELEPFNRAADDTLIAAGYTRARVEADWADYGDAENGPDLDGHPAFDQYEDADSHVLISEDGCTCYEMRDLEMERYVEAMGVECDSYAR